MAHHWCAISIWCSNGAPRSAPLVQATVRHQNASQGPYVPMCFAILMAHQQLMRHQCDDHSAPLVSCVVRHQYEYQGFFSFLIFSQVTKYIIGQNLDNTTQQQQIHRIQQKISLRIQFIILVSEFKRPNKDKNYKSQDREYRVCLHITSRYRSSKLPSHRREPRSSR